MEPYVKNPSCSCSRCRSGRLLLPALIVTAGLLFLLDQNSSIDIESSWPVLLLVAGLFSFLSRSASTEGHVQPYMTMPMPMAMTVPVPQPGMAQPNFAQPGMAQPGMAQPGMAQPGMAQPGMAQPGMAQAGMAQAGTPQAGMPAQPSMTNSTAEQQGTTHSSNDDSQVNS